MSNTCKIKIIDYKAGNAPIVLHAVERLGYQAELAAVPKQLENAECIILPGVGSAGATMDSLKESGMADTLTEYILDKKIPFLGVCVGMQIFFEHSEEENAVCFGWLKGCVKKFDSTIVRVPQMGWNKVRFINKTPINANTGYFYFVNSYYAKPEDQSDTWGISNYGNDFTAAVRKDNIFGTQFHIEKSGEAGLLLLNEFLTYAGKIC